MKNIITHSALVKNWKTFLILFFLFNNFILNAQTPPAIQWQQVIGEDEDIQAAPMPPQKSGEDSLYSHKTLKAPFSGYV